MQKTLTVTAVLAVFAALGGSAFAQSPPPPPAAANPPTHHGLFGNMFHHNKPTTGGTNALSGSIIGNKNTHVYHLAGDKGALPDPKNRVYFRTAAQAEAAGYHQAGKTSTTTSHSGSGHLMHSKPMMAPGHPMTH